MRLASFQLLSYLCKHAQGHAVIFSNESAPEYCEALPGICAIFFRCAQGQERGCQRFSDEQRALCRFDADWRIDSFWGEQLGGQLPKTTNGTAVFYGGLQDLPAPATRLLAEQGYKEILYLSYGEWWRLEICRRYSLMKPILSAWAEHGMGIAMLVVSKARGLLQKGILRFMGENLHERGVTHFLHDGGQLYKAFVPHLAEYSDRYNKNKSRLFLFDERTMLMPHQSHFAIRHLGGGRFSHWENDIYFSSIDSSDPNANGRRYRYVLLAGTKRLLAPIFGLVFPKIDDSPNFALDREAMLQFGDNSGEELAGFERRTAPGGVSGWFFKLRKGKPLTSFLKSPPFEKETARLMALDQPRGLERIGRDLTEVNMIIGTLGSGGSERQLSYLTRGLRKKGYRVRIYTNCEPRPEMLHYLPFIKECGAEHAFFTNPHPDFDFRCLANPWGVDDLALMDKMPEEYGREVWNIYTHLMVNKPRVLHCWLDHTNIVGGIAGWLAGVPKIVLSTRNVNPTHFPYLYKDWYLPWYQRLATSSRVELVANSLVGAKSYAEWMNVPVDRFTVIHNGIDLDIIRNIEEQERRAFREDLGISHDAPLIAGVFRLSVEKQPQLFLDVVSDLAKEMPALRVVVAGIGPMEAEFKSQIGKLGLSERVMLLGRREDVPVVMSAADLVMLTSSEEGFPNVLMEAQSLGRPVVCTNAGGIPEVVKDAEGGFICKIGDRASLARRCRELLANAELRAKMGEAARAWVRESFSLDRMVERTDTIYRLSSDDALKIQDPNGAYVAPERPAFVSPVLGVSAVENEDAATAAPPGVTAAHQEPQAAAEPEKTEALWTSANPMERKLKEAVDFDIRNARSQLNFLPGGWSYAQGRVCMEVGPGQDIGIPLIIMGYGASAYVVDKYLCHWDDAYHPKFYRELRREAEIHFPDADFRALDEVIANNDHKAEGLHVLRLGLEEVEGVIADGAIDWSFSNATFEHLFDHHAACLQLGRITKAGGLGFHQTDFRDHRDFSVPLEYLTMPDDEFAALLKAVDCSCGNRMRYTDFLPSFEEAGFDVRVEPSLLADPAYLEDVMQRSQTRFRNDYPIEAFKVLSGRFFLVRRAVAVKKAVGE